MSPRSDSRRRALSRARQNLVAECYYDDANMAHYLCEVCGRALCDAHRRQTEEADRCPECCATPPPSWWICGRCGWLAPEARPECSACGLRAELLPRRPAPGAHWERHYRGHSRESYPYVLGIVWVLAMALGLYPWFMMARQSPGPAAVNWLIYLVVVSLATGVVAALVVRQRAAFELILSTEGVMLAWRGRGYRLELPWEDVLGLELSRTLAMAQFRLLGPARILPLERNCRGYREAVGLIRQHAAVAPAPFRAW